MYCCNVMDMQLKDRGYIIKPVDEKRTILVWIQGTEEERVPAIKQEFLNI